MFEIGHDTIFINVQCNFKSYMDFIHFLQFSLKKGFNGGIKVLKINPKMRLLHSKSLPNENLAIGTLVKIRHYKVRNSIRRSTSICNR